MAQSLRRILIPVVLLSTWLVCRPSHAKPSDDPYDLAKEAEGRLDYKSVIAHANDALDLANNHERLVALYSMLGTACGVLGRNEQSVDAFTRLLAIDPDHRLPRGLSPKVTKPFKEAGGYWLDRPGGLAVLPNIPREIAGGKPLSISVKVEDPLQMGAKVRLSYRQEGTPDYTKAEEPSNAAGVTFSLPPEQIPVRAADYSFELFFTVLGPTGSELRSAGEAAHPLLITVRASREPTLVTENPNGVIVTTTPPPPKKPLIKQWWLWTAVGAVVVVGAAVGGGLGWYYGRPDTSHVDVTLSSRTAP